jgi:hypothetical protein
MGKLIDESLLQEKLALIPMEERTFRRTVEELENAPTVEAIPKEEVRQFIENIQKIKDNHNEYGEPINYGTICGILIEGHRLLDKYKRGKDGNDD